MWGRGRARASSPACFTRAVLRRTRGMHAIERPVEILGQNSERQIKRRPPADQNVIVSRPHSFGWCEPHNLLQSPAHPVAHDRIADFAGDRETYTHRAILAPIPRLQQETCS
jgi:hypothetical protein